MWSQQQTTQELTSSHHWTLLPRRTYIGMPRMMLYMPPLVEKPYTASAPRPQTHVLRASGDLYSFHAAAPPPASASSANSGKSGDLTNEGRSTAAAERCARPLTKSTIASAGQG